MAKIVIILVFVGLTVMPSAYRMRGPNYYQDLQTEILQDQRAQLIMQLQGTIIWSYTHLYY